MSDLISRQDAIETLHNHYEVRNPEQNAIMDECVMLIFNLPSALPEPCEDTISRQAAIDKCQHRLYESALNNIGYECKADEVFSDIAQNRIQTWLEEVPSAERKGQWIDRSDGGRVLYPWYESYECSECGYTGSRVWNYCPNCGAKMEGEEE